MQLCENCPFEQKRDIIGRAEHFEDRPVIQTKFIDILHQHLNRIELSEELIITDPFALNSTHAHYETFLKGIFEPLYGKVRKITFITAEKYHPELFNRLQTHASGRCYFRHFINKNYHDRFWISTGNQRGIYVGHSLTGIGKQYCYVGPLPDEDAKMIYDSLKELIY